MGCVKPLEAYRGKHGVVTFNRHLSVSRVAFKLPCGRCIGCRLERARQWGLRCMHEAKLWPQNCFITLTYSDEFLPPYGSLSVRDIQLFMKRLRKGKKASASNPIRFFLGGEYGERNLRPHYHAVLFNCGFADRRLLSNAGGVNLYTSDELSGYWSGVGEASFGCAGVSDGGGGDNPPSRAALGHASIGEVNYKTAIYCAKCALKRVNGEMAESHYGVMDQDGCLHMRVPEFALMSRRPGIGHGYYEKYGSEYLEHDNVIVDGREAPGCRFYDGRSDTRAKHDDDRLLCFCRYCSNKRKRKLNAAKARSDNTPERLDVKERIMEANASRKERRL